MRALIARSDRQHLVSWFRFARRDDSDRLADFCHSSWVCISGSLHEHDPPTAQLVDVRQLPAALARGLVLLAQQHGENLDGRVETERVRTPPPLQARDADARPELRREVEVAQDFLVERHVGLVDCDRR